MHILSFQTQTKLNHSTKIVKLCYKLLRNSHICVNEIKLTRQHQTAADSDRNHIVKTHKSVMKQFIIHATDLRISINLHITGGNYLLYE